jgi:hypothetical protein
MEKKKNITKVVHKGRAANCECRSMAGQRCPDCNHLLTGPISMEHFGEMYPITYQVAQCAVCGRKITPPEIEEKKKEIRLVVQDSNQSASSEF